LLFSNRPYGKHCSIDLYLTVFSRTVTSDQAKTNVGFLSELFVPGNNIVLMLSRANRILIQQLRQFKG